MKRIVILVMAIMLLAIPASAGDQECTTITIERTDREQPFIADVHYASEGVRVALVGNYLWTQYETTSDPADGGAVLSTEVGPSVTAVEACPNGIVTLFTPADNEVSPLPAEDGSYLAIDVILYWLGQGYMVY